MMKNFPFKKKYGQNFLVDKNKIQEIISAASLDKETLVVEIGPGDGALTSYLAIQSKQVLSYEIDTDLKESLSRLEENYPNLTIIYQDFLTVNLKETLQNYTYQKLCIVSNLPYYITTPIIEKILKERILVSKMVLMMQKEAGIRFLALPGDKDYSSIHVLLSYYYLLSKLTMVHKNCFYPVPNVDSMVLLLTSKKEKLFLEDEEFFISFVKDAFLHKRKNLRNNLKKYDLKLLEKGGFDLSKRAEQLSLEDFVQMANYLFKNQ